MLENKISQWRIYMALLLSFLINKKLITSTKPAKGENIKEKKKL
jgi:hypothetical protein